MNIWLKRIVLVIFALVIAGAAIVMIRPQPVPVDLGSIEAGPIETTINEDGTTRVKDVYRISAPISGKLERVAVDVGDEVAEGDHLARIRPVDPPIRDVRTRRELAAATRASEAAVDLARAAIAEARSALEFSKSELERAQRLARSSTISERTLQSAEFDVAMKTVHLTEAEANLVLRQSELDSAHAREAQPANLDTTEIEDSCCIAVVSPVNATVLTLHSVSEQVVQAGTPVLDVGHLRKLEVVVDLLSADAVSIAPGTLARIEAWGGGPALNARVRRIDPAGFTKVSALGIEEQRVNVILDIVDPPDSWARLGHAYRVIVHLITDSKDNVTLVPLSALFRTGGAWTVFVSENGRANLKAVELGLFSRTHVEVISGLQTGEQVVVYPSDRIEEGTAIVPR